MILTFAPVGRLTTLFIYIYTYICTLRTVLCIYVFFFLIIYTRAPPIQITNGITNYIVDINNKYTYILYKHRFMHSYVMYKTRNNLMEIRIIFRTTHNNVFFSFHNTPALTWTHIYSVMIIMYNMRWLIIIRKIILIFINTHVYRYSTMYTSIHYI